MSLLRIDRVRHADRVSTGAEMKDTSSRRRVCVFGERVASRPHLEMRLFVMTNEVIAEAGNAGHM